jgi:hypothetical protein
VVQLKVTEYDDKNILVAFKQSSPSSSELKITPIVKEKSFYLKESSSSSSSSSSLKPSQTPPKLAAAKSPKPHPGLLLDELKTGFELQGTVITSTPYAAFISAKVFRKGKGGSFSEVNGMLHKNDISDQALLALNPPSSGTNKKSNSLNSNLADLLNRGSKLTVYVKEVYKNSGYNLFFDLILNLFFN